MKMWRTAVRRYYADTMLRTAVLRYRVDKGTGQKESGKWPPRRRGSVLSIEERHQSRRYKSVRLSHYDYASAGGYSVTMVTTKRACLFGEIQNGEMILSDLGRIIQNEWLRSAEIRKEITLDEFIVMPNHLHGIVLIGDVAHCRAALPSDKPLWRKRERRPRSLSTLISGFKAYSTKCINEHRITPGQRLWQPSFYEHIIRSDHELAQLREYIVNNPLKWHLDGENPERLNHDCKITR